MEGFNHLRCAVFFLLVFAVISPVYGQRNITDARNQSWRSPLLSQLDYLISRLDEEIQPLSARYKALGILSLTFDAGFVTEFREVAKFETYDTFLNKTPPVSLKDCPECRQTRSQVKNGQLTISRGIQNSQIRQDIAKTLGVQGFLLARFTIKDEQLILVFQIIDANTGKVILSKSIAGLLQAHKALHYIFGLGFFDVPFAVDGAGTKSIKNFSLTAEQLVSLPSGLGFSTKFFVFNGKQTFNRTVNALTSPYNLGITGIALSGAVNYQWSFNVEQNFSARAFFGIGRAILFRPAFTGENFYDYGVTLVFNQNFVMTLQYIKLGKVVEFDDNLPQRASGDWGKKAMSQMIMGWQF